MTFDQLIHEITQHERNNPTHGINCACMDDYIRKFREMSEAPISRREQQRVDYVIRTAVDNRR